MESSVNLSELVCLLCFTLITLLSRTLWKEASSILSDFHSVTHSSWLPNNFFFYCERNERVFQQVKWPLHLFTKAKEHVVWWSLRCLSHQKFSFNLKYSYYSWYSVRAVLVLLSSLQTCSFVSKLNLLSKSFNIITSCQAQLTIDDNNHCYRLHQFLLEHPHIRLHKQYGYFSDIHIDAVKISHDNFQ